MIAQAIQSMTPAGRHQTVSVTLREQEALELSRQIANAVESTQEDLDPPIEMTLTIFVERDGMLAIAVS